jgi:hypothetical protein
MNQVSQPQLNSVANMRNLPPMRPRKNSDTHMFVDADTYQAAILNIKLPHGFKLLEEDNFHKIM